MKKRSLLSLVLCVALILAACGGSAPRKYSPKSKSKVALQATEPAPSETQPEPTVPETEPEATEPAHSEYYIEGLSVEDVILYFNEVCLDAEFTTSGDSNLVQKWTAPIYYTLHGEYTQEDLATLTGLTDWLNTIDGFPGIYETQDPSLTVLQIFFCTEEELIDRMGDHMAGSDAAVTFWYENNEIYSAIICYRTDLDQYLRNSVILEEIYNGLGPVQDTTLREDSIIYQHFTQPQCLTEIDELILKLLYHPQITCGMDAEACETVIRQLYY